MPGQHRKPTATRKLAPLAVCGVAATVIGIVTVEMGSTQAAQPAPVAEARPEPARDQAPAAAPAPLAPAPIQQAAAADPALMAKAAIQHSPCSSVLAGALPHVAQVGHLIGKTFAVADIGGAIGRGNDDHGAGLALDFMTSDPAHGSAIADFVLANKERFGVTYVIWQQRYNDGSGWSYMEDRGSPTANHYDHVHVSFAPSADVNLIC